MKQNSNTIKRYLQNLILCIMTLMIIFAILELGFRIAKNPKKNTLTLNSTQQMWAIYDKDLGYRNRPNHADFNSDGLRDDPIDINNRKFKVLILGDSIPFYGDNIADTYVGLLESKLNADPEFVPTDVINAGVKGYTNYQELVYLKKYGLRFQPDLVGVSFCLNDLHKFLHQFEIQDGEIVAGTYHFTKEAIKTVENPLYQILRKSRFLVWLRYKLNIFKNVIEFKTRDGFSFDYRQDFNTAWKDQPWVEIEGQLREMVNLGEKNGFRLFLVVFPFGEQLRQDYLKRDYDYVTKPQRKVKAICEKLNIPLLDLFYNLDPKKHLLKDQIHLTKEGRQLVAKKIAIFLKQKGLIQSYHSSS